MKIAIFHNIMWAKYKGGVFSAIHKLTQNTDTTVSFTQVAETEGDRAILSSVDLTYHQYPFELLFKGSYNSVPTWKRTLALASKTWHTDADIVILPGFERVEYWTMLAVLVMRKKTRAVFCDSTANDRPHNFVKSIAKRMFFFLCNGFFCYGERSQSYLMMHGAPAENIYFRRQAAALPHGYTEQNAIAQRSINAPRPGDGPDFVYAGRLSNEKGLGTLLQAMALFTKDYPSAKLRIIGAGPLEEQLINQISGLKISNNVHMLGSMDIDNLVKEYSKSTAFILPSSSEPWGLVVNEAMHQGCPCIVSDACGCVPELIIEGKTGVSFKSGDHVDLYRKMAIAAQDFSETSRTSLACIEHIRNFTPETTARQIVAACNKIYTKNIKAAA